MNKAPLLYHRTTEQIEEYRKVPAIRKIKWLEAQMEFFYYAMSDKAKKIRESINSQKARKKQTSA